MIEPTRPRFEIGERYEVSDFREAGYFALKKIRLKNPLIIQRYGTEEVVRWKRGDDNYLVVRESGLLRVIAYYRSDPEERTKIFKLK